MRYFRDTTFVTWAFLLLALVVVTVFSFSAGTTVGTPKPGERGRAVLAAYRSDADVQVDQLRSLMGYGVAAGKDLDALSKWAQQVQATADQGSTTRALEGAAPNDQLLKTFQYISTTAGQLQQTSEDTVAATSYRTAILLAVDRATNLVNGVPVPPNIDPVVGISNPDLVQPELPDVYATTRPQLDPPLPGQSHTHNKGVVPSKPNPPTVPSIDLSGVKQ